MFFNVSLIAHKGINIFFALQILVRIFLFNLPFVTYSAAPARRLSFGASRIGFYPSVRAAQAFNLRHILGCASSPTFLRLSFAYPSLILRSSFAQASLRRILNCGSASRTGKAGTGGGGIGT